MTQSTNKELPLSPCQMLIVADLQSHPQTAPAYNLDDYIEIEGPLDVDLLHEAIQRTVARTASLRIKVNADHHRYSQIVRPNVATQVSKVNLSHSADPDSQAIEWMKARRQECFDPFGDELLRLGILRLTENKVYLHGQCHHLAADGIGLQVFKARVADTYCKLLQDADYYPDDDQEMFENYLQYDRQYEATAQRVSDVEYWSNLNPSPTTLTVRRHLHRHHASALQSPFLRLSAELSEKLASLAQALELRLPQLFISAFVLYANGILKRRELTIDLPTHGRVEPWMSSLTAACANVLPVTIALNPEDDVRKALQRINEQIRTALSHKRLSRIEIRASQRSKCADLRSCSISVNALPYSTHLRYGDAVGTQRVLWAPYVDDLAACLFIGAAGNQTIRLDANPVNFHQWEIESHLHRFHEFLTDLSGASEPQRLDLPVSASEKKSKADIGICVHEYFERLATASPCAIASIECGEHFSYADVDKRANQIAHALIARGVGPRELVGLYTRNSVEAGIALLGILKAGAICAPYNQIADSIDKKVISIKCAVIDVAHRDQAARFASAIVLGTDEIDQPMSRPTIATLATDACYAVASNGGDKLHCVAHANVLQRAQIAARTLGLNSADRVALQFSSPTQFWLHGLVALWSVGATAVAAQAHSSTEEELKLLRDTAARAALLSTAHWCRWVQLLCVSPNLLSDSLRTIVVGGQTIPRATLSKWLGLEATRAIATFNVFGSGLSGGIVASKRVESQDLDDCLTVFTPLENSRLQVVDDQDRPLSDGIVGDLYMNSNGERVRLETRARVRPDGQFELFAQPNVRNINDETMLDITEAEDAMQQHPAVLHAAVVTHFQNLRTCLVCYYVTLPHSSVAREPLRTYLLERVHSYLIPSHFIELSELPLDTNGDVDRHSLALRRLPMESVVEYVAPRNPVEVSLIAIWTEALQVERIGVHDNLFDLGADSISSTFALACMEDQFGVPTDMALLFEYGTVAQLAERVGATHS